MSRRTTQKIKEEKVNEILWRMKNNVYQQEHVFWERSKKGLMKMSLQELDAFYMVTRNVRKYLRSYKVFTS